MGSLPAPSDMTVNSDGMLSPAPPVHPQVTSLEHLVSPWTPKAQSQLQLVQWSNEAVPQPPVQGTALEPGCI